MKEVMVEQEHILVYLVQVLHTLEVVEAEEVLVQVVLEELAVVVMELNIVIQVIMVLLIQVVVAVAVTTM
jgi:hypothetical protein